MKFIKKIIPNRFVGADDIHFTPKNIAVRKSSTGRNGINKVTTTYIPKTKSRMKQALKTHGSIKNASGGYSYLDSKNKIKEKRK